MYAHTHTEKKNITAPYHNTVNLFQVKKATESSSGGLSPCPGGAITSHSPADGGDDAGQSYGGSCCRTRLCAPWLVTWEESARHGVSKQGI